MIKKEFICDFCGKPIVLDKHDKKFNFVKDNKFNMVIKSPATGKQLKLECQLTLQQIIGESQKETVLEDVETKYSGEVVVDEIDIESMAKNPIHQIAEVYANKLQKYKQADESTFHLCQNCHRGIALLFAKSAKYRTTITF